MPGEPHGLKSLSGYSPKVSNTERLSKYACTLVTTGAAIDQPKSVNVSMQKSQAMRRFGTTGWFLIFAYQM